MKSASVRISRLGHGLAAIESGISRAGFSRSILSRRTKNVRLNKNRIEAVFENAGMKTMASTVSSPTALTLRAAVDPRTSEEKNWDLDKPVTLIGSGEHADIIISQAGVSCSHAVVVNTGQEALLIDLLSASGTYCNDQQVRIQLLEDGDVIRVGETEIHLGIEKTRHIPPAGVGQLELRDPYRMPIPVALERVDRREHCNIQDSVAIIGSHAEAQVHIDEEEVALAHSIVFAARLGIAIYDLGSDKPLKINGREKKFAYLRHRDRILVGGIGFMVQSPSQENDSSPNWNHQITNEKPEMSEKKERKQKRKVRELNAVSDSQVPSGEPRPDGASGEQPDLSATDMQGGSQAESALNTLEQKIGALQQEIAQSWGQLNEWKKRLVVEQNQTTVRTQDLDNKEKLLEQMADELDIRVHELAERETRLKESEAQTVSQQSEIEKAKQDIKQEIEKSKLDHQQREEDIEARCNELSRLANELDLREGEVKQFAEQFETRRKELEALKESVAVDSDALEKDRQALYEMQAELKAESEKFTARQAELEQTENELRQQIADCEAGLEKTEVELRQQIGDREAELEKTETELRQQIGDREAELEKTETELRQRISDREAELAKTEAELRQQIADRETELEKTETELRQQISDREVELERIQADLQSTQQDLEEREQSIFQRQDQLADYETKLQAKWEELSERAKQFENRSMIIERFGQFLEEAKEAYQITVDSEVELGESGIPKVPEANPSGTLADSAEAIQRTHRQMHSTVDGLEAQTRQMMEDFSPSESAETSPGSGSDSTTESTQESNQNCDSTSEQPPVQESEIDQSSLEPEVRLKLRLLKRLGGSSKSDTELVEQIRVELEQSEADAKSKKGKSWWSRQ